MCMSVCGINVFQRIENIRLLTHSVRGIIIIISWQYVVYCCCCSSSYYYCWNNPFSTILYTYAEYIRQTMNMFVIVADNWNPSRIHIKQLFSIYQTDETQTLFGLCKENITFSYSPIWEPLQPHYVKWQHNDIYIFRYISLGYKIYCERFAVVKSASCAAAVCPPAPK